MIKRNITKTLFALEKSYPVITITGPRQSGKTTLAKNILNPDFASLYYMMGEL